MWKKTTTYLYLIWVIALMATLGSLFFSEVLGFAPCVLCWYQRIIWYPMVLLLPIAIIRKDLNILIYTFALTIPGIILAGFHTLLYWKIIPETLAPCKLGVSCTTEYINWLGFINIPFMSLLGFITIIILIYFARRNSVKVQ